MIFDLAGRATIELLDERERARALVRALMDPYAPRAARDEQVDIVLEARERDRAPWRDVHNPAGDGVVTASDGVALHLVRHGLGCSLPALEDGAPMRFTYDPGFPIWSAFAAVIRPSIHLQLLDRGAAAVHSASVALDGRGVVVAGWSETGKTETALAFLELGARFVSDKWTILDRTGTLDPFPISVGVRRWVLPFLPSLSAALPRRAAAQLAIAGAADRLTRPLRRLEPRAGAASFAVGALERAVALADRAALTPSELAAAYGQEGPARRIPATCVALLRTTPGPDVKVSPADRDWAVRRLARSAAFERRGLFELHRRARYAFPDRNRDVEREMEEREQHFLVDALSDTLLLDVQAPFPVDPRRVANAIADGLP